MANLTGYLEDRHELDDLEHLLAQRHLNDPSDPGFALTSRTRPIRVQGTEGEDDPKLRPLAVALAIPRGRRDPLWAASDWNLFDWMQDANAKYPPMNRGRCLGQQPKPMHGGIIAPASDHRSGTHYASYAAIERTGVVELGMGTDVCVIRDKDVVYLLTPLVARVRHLLNLASDLYQHVRVSEPFSLVLALRETAGALLGGLAEGWREPWEGFRDYRPVCREPAVLLIHRGIGPVLDADHARRLAREVAYEIEAAWGHGGPRAVARCFKRSEDEGEGEFDVNAARR